MQPYMKYCFDAQDGAPNFLICQVSYQNVYVFVCMHAWLCLHVYSSVILLFVASLEPFLIIEMWPFFGKKSTNLLNLYHCFILVGSVSVQLL